MYDSKQRIIQARYYQRHKEKLRVKALASYHARKESIALLRKAVNQMPQAKNKHKLAERKRRINRREHVNKLNRIAYAANPLPKRERANKRWALQHGGTKGAHTQQQWLARVTFFGWRCTLQMHPRCLGKLSLKTLTKDHTIPLSKGGTEWPANLRPACGFCNSAKGNKTCQIKRK